MSAKKPAIPPTTATPPVLRPPEFPDVTSAILELDLVDVAVGFSIGTDGRGTAGVRPLIEELCRGEGGDIEGGNDEFVTGGGDWVEGGGGESAELFGGGANGSDG